MFVSAKFAALYVRKKLKGSNFRSVTVIRTAQAKFDLCVNLKDPDPSTEEYISFQESIRPTTQAWKTI